MERLQKILSQAGVASRRAGEQLMTDGRVTVNGVTVRELGTKADAARDDILVDGRRVKVAAHHRYILLNKPRGYVTTRSDPERRPTVSEASPVFVSDVARMITAPVAIAVTSPVCETTAIDGSSDDHVTTRSVSAAPFASRTVAVACAV